MLHPRSRSRLTAAVTLLALIAASLQRADAQEASPFVVRIFQLTMGRYTCTALMADHQLEQLTVVTNQGAPPPSELRRGPATDEDIKKIDELLREPGIRNAASDVPRFPAIVKRDGKSILVLGRVEGKPKIVQFTDTEGTRRTPDYLKGFEAFAEDVRRRKLPKPGGKVTPNCRVTMD